MDNKIRKCIIEQNCHEHNYLVHHTSKDKNGLREKIKLIEGVDACLNTFEYTIEVQIAKCFNVERVLDAINKTVLCFDLNKE